MLQYLLLKLHVKDFKEEFKTLKETLKNAPYFENYEDLVKYIKEKTGLENEKISKPLRYILQEEKWSRYF